MPGDRPNGAAWQAARSLGIELHAPHIQYCNYMVVVVVASKLYGGKSEPFESGSSQASICLYRMNYISMSRRLI
jgi:hypothetical protein